MRAWHGLVNVLKQAGRHEAALLSLVALMALLLWAFAEVADHVIVGSSAGFDRRVLLAMRNPADSSDPLGPPWLEEMGRDFTALGGVGVLALLTGAVALLMVFEGKLRTVLFLLTAVGGGVLVSLLLKLAYLRPRPDLVPHGSIVYATSFPSGHSTMAAVTYLTLGAVLMRSDSRPAVRVFLLLLGVALTVLVGISRVYLGVHWPSDVLAGWAIGSAWAVLCSLTALWLQKRGAVEPPTNDAVI